MSTTDKASTEAPNPSEDAADATDATDTADATETAAGAQLSTAPAEDGGGPVGIGVIGWIRWFWRQLTSMRVALILLFLLSWAPSPARSSRRTRSTR